MTRHARDRHPRPTRFPALVAIALAVLAQVLTPAVQAWHLASEDGAHAAAIRDGAPPAASMKAPPAPAAPAHHHDEGACAVCQLLIAGSRATLEMPPLPMIGMAPAVVERTPCRVLIFALRTADLAVRPPRGPPAA